MPKLFFNSENCTGATSELSGRHYQADRQGFINVENSADAKFLKAGGYIEAGGMPHIGKYWLCECGWESAINSCPHCNRNDLTKVES